MPIAVFGLSLIEGISLRSLLPIFLSNLISMIYVYYEKIAGEGNSTF
jgi:hypothetical protein